ncbi:NAD/NADP octopine/nopaline dehydrogenase family protein [Brevibacillus choshinensis]|uniref:NAD/NADP octopine/nopaline dehydrogenase family protein n=1 Tax=Brevibacillus choshinensis TaxID=54911 RepID=UPI002E245266|nr:NAD/NADP octopine/nopaline dehydrogenase family protein [Brevibacillus choshinensis]MED4782583.1 NAD/NADP octopine/nopaline dehydrogenase family protein [Brevibacillus choshinensis]
MKFAVIGGGNTGQTFAAFLTLQGQEAILFDRNEEKVKNLEVSGIRLQNRLVGHVHVPVTTSIEEAIRGASVILVTTTAGGHKEVCQRMKCHLQEGQTIIIMPGYWGALEFSSILGDVWTQKRIVLAETDAMMLVCRSLESGVIDVKAIKSKITVGAIPAGQATGVVQQLKHLFPQWEAVSSVLETSLNNTNVTVHPPVMLFNAGRVDAVEPFKFYYQGATQRTTDYIEQIDQERLQIAVKLGVGAVSLLTLLNTFYQRDFDDLYNALRTIFSTSIAPLTFSHRYITEDIPYGLVPISELGRKLGVKTPYTDKLIEIASLYLSKDFRAEGVRLDMDLLVRNQQSGAQ